MKQTQLLVTFQIKILQLLRLKTVMEETEFTKTSQYFFNMSATTVGWEQLYYIIHLDFIWLSLG